MTAPKPEGGLVPRPTRAELRRRFAAAPVAVLVTVRPDGAPHAVPFVFAVHGDTIYSAVDDKPKRGGRLQRLANLAAHPEAAALVHHYDDDWRRLWWVRADGRGRVLDEDEERAAAVAALAAKYPHYVTMPPTGPVIGLDVHRWSGWTAAGVNQ